MLLRKGGVICGVGVGEIKTIIEHDECLGYSELLKYSLIEIYYISYHSL